MSGWGRWGPDDERGAANLLGASATARALASIQQHRSISLDVPIVSGLGIGVVGRQAPQHVMLRDGGDYAGGRPEHGGFGFADDAITLATHGVTHMDALSHVWQGGLMYNGHSANEVTSQGARKLGISGVGPIVTRGVLVDFVQPGERWLTSDHRVGVEELKLAVKATGVTIEPGDALLMRTGWVEAWQAGEADASTWAGLDADCAEWLIEQDLVLLGADNVGVEAFPSSDPMCQVPLHVALLRGHGVYFCELLNLAELALAGQATFMLVIAPLNLVGGVGSPIAPVAVL